MQPTLFQKILSYFTPLSIEIREGELTKRIRVEYFYGKYHLGARRVNYSGGGLYEVFRNVLRKKHFGRYEFKNILVLGLGGGDIVKLIRHTYKKNAPITGIEGDKVILELGEKYFELGEIENLKRVHADAINFLENNTEKFDLIIVDLFVDCDVPPQFHTEEFAKLVASAASKNPLVLFNKMLYDTSLRTEMDKVDKSFQSVFKSVERIKTSAYWVENIVLWCEGLKGKNN